MAELTGKTVAELPLDTSVTGSELLPVMDGTTSKRVPLQAIGAPLSGTSLDNGNIDDALAVGSYFVSDPSTVTGTQPPTLGRAYKLVVYRAYTVSAVPREWQIAYEVPTTSSPNPFREHRRFYGTNGWGDWETLNPSTTNTRLDGIDTKLTALGNGNVSFSRVSVANGGNTDIPIENNQKGFIVLTSAIGNSCGMYAFYCGTQGGMYIKALAEGSYLTLTGSTNNINIANGANQYAFALVVFY